MPRRDAILGFRIAAPSDEPILWHMLKLAVFVSPGGPAPDESMLARPELARYVKGWGRRGDDGVIALDVDGHPIGAAWLRLWSAVEHGYGFVDLSTPELSIAVCPEYRGRGVGTELLSRLLERADESYESVSLSVSIENPAQRLYQRLGFVSVRVEGTSIVMRRRRPEEYRSVQTD